MVGKLWYIAVLKAEMSIDSIFYLLWEIVAIFSFRGENTCRYLDVTIGLSGQL